MFTEEQSKKGQANAAKANSAKCKRNQQAFFEIMDACHWKKSYIEVAKEIGIAPDTIYGHWINENRNGFKDELERRRNQHFDELTDKAIEALNNLVLEGNWNAVKYVLDYAGKGTAQKVEMTSDNVIKINITNEENNA